METKILSIALEMDVYLKLKDLARRSGRRQVSKTVRELILKFVGSANSNEIPVLLRIPAHLKSDHDELKKWFDAKADVLMDALLLEEAKKKHANRSS